MRVQPRITYGKGALHKVGHAKADDEEVVDLAVARLAARGVDHSAYLLYPPGSYQLGRCAVPSWVTTSGYSYRFDRHFCIASRCDVWCL